MIQKVKGKKYLINGGLGMIGSTVATILVEAGAEVTIVDAMIKPFCANLFNIEKIKDQVKTRTFDIKSIKDMKREIENKDVIFNLAGQISHNDSIINPLYNAKLNYLYQLSVMECIRQVNPNAKVIFSGSRLQFGKIKNIQLMRVIHPILKLHMPFTNRPQRTCINFIIVNTVLTPLFLELQILMDQEDRSNTQNTRLSIFLFDKP